MCRALLKQVLKKLSLREYKTADKAILEKELKKENYNMQEEEKKVVEQPKEEVAEKKEVPEKEVPQEKEETKVEDKKEAEVQAEKEEEKKEVPEEEAKPQVEETGDEFPAVRIEDLVTKADLQELLSAFNAKLDAVIKENQDLKEANAKMHDKYEVGDFGNEVKNGVMPVSKPTPYQSFDEYSKQFM